MDRWRLSPGRVARPIVVVAVVALLTALLASCGGDDDAATTSSSATSATTAASSSTSTTASSTSESTSPTTTTTSASTTSTSESTTRTVLVYFSTGDGSDCSEVSAFERTVNAAIGPALAAFTELAGGPTQAEADVGAGSFFSSATANAVQSVGLSNRTLTVDFDDIRAEISNAGTSCGSAAFTAGLNQTAFQFPTVDRVRYQFDGSCEDFGEFIQTGSCEFDRSR